VSGQGCRGIPPGGYYYQRVKRDRKWAWASLGRDPSTAWNKSLAQAKVRKPEFVPGIPGVPDRKPEPTPAATPSGYRVDDEVRVYLTNVPKLAPKPTELTSGLWNCFRTPARKSTFTRSASKTSRSSTLSRGSRMVAAFSRVSRSTRRAISMEQPAEAARMARVQRSS